MNAENSKTIQTHRFAFSLPQRLDLKSSNKYAASQNFLFITLAKYKGAVQKQAQTNSTNVE